jgi:glutathione S-transferase
VDATASAWHSSAAETAPSAAGSKGVDISLLRPPSPAAPLVYAAAWHAPRENRSMWKFYYAPHSCALASHLALEHVGADYEAVRVDFASTEQRTPAYLAVNPKGRVPSLVTERGILSETPALLLFICQTHPDAGLAPLGDPFALARLQAFNCYLCATLHVAHAHRMRGYRWADEPEAIAAMQRKVPQSVTECFALVERTMFEGPWVMGERYTACDMYLFTFAQWLELDGVDLTKIPRILDHRSRMLRQPLVQKVIAQELA